MLCNPFHRRAAESYLFCHDTSVSDIVKIGPSLKILRIFERGNPSYFGTQGSFIGIKQWNNF